MHTLGFFYGYPSITIEGFLIFMKKNLFSIVIAFAMLVGTNSVCYASDLSKSSAQLNNSSASAQKDNRAQILKSFLSEYNSPLAPFSEDFVASADRYNLDWKLVAAISGLESTFGHQIPYNSYNGWGWGVYGDNVIRFKSWKEGIETISKGLRERYLKDKLESDPYVIGPTYASSPTWAVRVAYFMQAIENYKIRNAKSTLSLSI